MKNEIIVKANMTGVPSEMLKATENLQNVLNNVNTSKKQLAKASYDLKVQAGESNVSFKEFIKGHFGAFDISDSRLYALAQTAETFDCDEYKLLWERIPVSKLEKMTRIKKAKLNKTVTAFGYIPFLQCVSFRAIEKYNLTIANDKFVLEELKAQMQEACKKEEYLKAQQLKDKINSFANLKPIEIPEDEEKQKAFYLSDGISRVCNMPDTRVAELVKLYNLYSDVIKPETSDSDNNDNNSNDNNSNDNNSNDNTEKTVPEMIADILARVQTLKEKAEKNNIELPNTTIQAFIECMENFGK